MEETQGYGSIVFEGEDGENLELLVLDYFFYNGKEFAVLADKWCGEGCNGEHEGCCDADCGCADCDVAIYYMAVELEGDEETFIPIEDEELLDALDEAYHAGQTDEE